MTYDLPTIGALALLAVVFAFYKHRGAARQSRRASHAVRAAESRFHLAFDQAPIGMALVELTGRVEQANKAFGAICERPCRDLIGLELRDLIHPADREQWLAILATLSSGRAENGCIELRLAPAAGSAVDVSAHCAVLKDPAERPTQVLCQFLDVTERNRFEAQLQFMADHDPLTGLANRRKFEQELERHVAQVKRYGPEGALLLLDVDHFKQVNDTLGHNSGDELIISIASVLRDRLRDSDVLARLGGDEFAVLLPKADETEAAQVAGALVHGVCTNAALLGGERKRVTASVGVAVFDNDTESLSAETILVEADLAMYDAKEAGRNRYAFYTTSEHPVSRTAARLAWANRIERALEDNRFVLVAQPIQDLRSGRISQYELLIRMLDDHDDHVPPATFLYIAERYGLIGHLDEWVAVRAIELIEQRPDLHLEINISGRSLGDRDLLRAIDNRLRSAPIDPAHLIFEVTETAAVANITQAQLFAQRLRDHNCRFALDDFGAGFGSFYYLKHLPFDYVKIDGEFVQHAASATIDQLVIQAIVRIARGLGKETIAEFVTNAETCRMVQQLGIDYAQGNHVGEPLNLEQLLGATVTRARAPA
jgi:diguanylate cyclase (GGDEF)-like protein/PAS domain S-box-containing protein